MVYHFMKRWGLIQGTFVFIIYLFLNIRFDISLHIWLLVLIETLVVVSISLQNTSRLKHGQPYRKLPLIGTFYTRDKYLYSGNKCITKDMPKQYVFKRPTGIILGKNRSNKYICKDLIPGDNLSAIYIGGSGCGKSSAGILPTIINFKEMRSNNGFIHTRSKR